MSEHTPGLWDPADRRHQKGGRITVLGPDGQHIVASGDNPDADDWLISSAPDLLAALEEASFQLGEVAPYWSRKEYEQRIWRVGRVVRAAIRKAKPDGP